MIGYRSVLESGITVPDGKTVTPINDVQVWLQCAGITDKLYTTIAQVLADGDVLASLLSNPNAVDYCVRSVLWADSIVADENAMKLLGTLYYADLSFLSDSTWETEILDSAYWQSVLTTTVPEMTGDTTPSGEAFANSVYSGYDPWRAFSLSDMTSRGWAPSSNANNNWIAYDFVTNVEIYKVMVYVDSFPSINVTLQASDNKTDGYTDVGTQFYVNKGTIIQTVENSSITGKRYWRLYGDFHTRGNGFKLQFYGRKIN